MLLSKSCAFCHVYVRVHVWLQRRQSVQRNERKYQDVDAVHSCSKFCAVVPEYQTDFKTEQPPRPLHFLGVPRNGSSNVQGPRSTVHSCGSRQNLLCVNQVIALSRLHDWAQITSARSQRTPAVCNMRHGAFGTLFFFFLHLTCCN